MRLLIDTNIILDIALKREPFYKDSANVFKKIDNKIVFGFVTATTITDIYYIAKKDKGHELAIEFIGNLIQFVDLIGIDNFKSSKKEKIISVTNKVSSCTTLKK